MKETLCCRCHLAHTGSNGYCAACRRALRFAKAGRTDLALLADELAPHEDVLRALAGRHFIRHVQREAVHA